MNYLADLYNAKELYNVSHKEKANEVTLGVSVYRFIKNRIRHMNWDAKFDDKNILREVLGLQIKIDYFCQNSYHYNFQTMSKILILFLIYMINTLFYCCVTSCDYLSIRYTAKS